MITNLSRLAAAINSARTLDEELERALRSQKERIILDLRDKGYSLVGTGKTTYRIYVDNNSMPAVTIPPPGFTNFVLEPVPRGKWRARLLARFQSLFNRKEKIPW